MMFNYTIMIKNLKRNCKHLEISLKYTLLKSSKGNIKENL